MSGSSSASDSLSTSVGSTALPADLCAAALLREWDASVSACARLDSELSDLLSQRADLERAVAKSVPSFIEQVEAVRRAQDGVDRTVQSSAASAQALSSKVRDLDLSASHVAAALQRVESVLSLRHTITRVREKLSSGALASAGDELYRALFVHQPIENDVSFAMLMDMERKLREELQSQAVQRYVRQARNAEAAAVAASSGGRAAAQAQQQTGLESKDVFKLARIWPKVGFNYRGLIMHCAQVRHECLALIHRSGWSVQNQMEGALIDYSRNVGQIIDTCNGFIVQHLLAVQNTFGPGSQIRLLQELLTNVIDVEVANKLLARFMDDKKIREPARGSTQPADDICSRIKQINAKVMAATNARAGSEAAAVVSYYNPRDPATTNPSSVLHITHLDELLDELKTLAHDMENCLKGINSLARQSVELLTDAVATEKQAREEAHAKSATSAADRQKADDAFARILDNPQDVSLMPSVHAQHHRVLTVLHRMLSEDKNKRNLIGVPIVEEKSNVFSAAKPALPVDAPVPAALLSLPSSSPFLLHGFGLDVSQLATGSKLYDLLLTLIGKYVLIEEFYMNYNVEKAIAIDEHDGSAFSEDGAAAPGSTDDLEAELLEAERAAKERERAAASGGLHSLASAAMTSLASQQGGGVDPYLYLTGIGGSLTGQGLPKSFVARFVTHKTSTLVDNVSFLYKKCMVRALKSSNRDAIYSILLRVHENFNRKLRKVFEGCISHYEQRFGAKKQSSATYMLHANPAAYLFPQQAGSRSNLLGSWVSNATSGVGGAPSAADVRRKVNGDVSLLLTVNNLDSTLENMQALLKYIDTTLEEMFGDEAAASSSSSAAPAISSNYSRGLSLDQLREKVHEFHSTFYAFDQLINRGLQMVADNCWLRLLPRLSLLQSHAAELYGQVDLSASASDHSDQILSGYCELFRRDVGGLAALLSENNFYQLSFKLIKLTVKYLENLVLPKQTGAGGRGQHDSHSSVPDGSPGASSLPCVRVSFSQSGGVVFDKQVRTLTSFFTNEVAARLERHFSENFFLYLQPAGATGGHEQASDYKQWRVSFSGAAQARQLFSKLGHVGSILSVDKPAEVLDYTERELFNLSKDEVRRILSLRKEFSEREINQLKL